MSKIDMWPEKKAPDHRTPDLEVQTVTHTFTIKELEKMLANAKAGGSVEVVFTIKKELVLR